MKTIGSVIAGAVLLVVQAQATTIPLINPSFEADGTTKIPTGFSTITGWGAFAPAVTGNENSGVESDSPPDGVMNAFMDAADTLTQVFPHQTTGYTITGGQMFQVSYAAKYTYASTGPGGGWSQPISAPEQQEADLYYVSGGAPVVFASYVITWDAGGAGVPWANYTFTGVAPSAANGDLLGVDFKNVTTDPNYYNWSEVDNVGLASVVPEPCSITLLSLGALALVAVRRRS